MTIAEYILTCKNFAADTANWGELADLKHYTTDGPGYWDESGDNAHGGLDLSWAFHCAADEIDRMAPGRYISQMIDDLSDALADRDLDLDQWRAVFEKYSLPFVEDLEKCRSVALSYTQGA